MDRTNILLGKSLCNEREKYNNKAIPRNAHEAFSALDVTTQSHASNKSYILYVVLDISNLVVVELRRVLGR